ncbi:MAG: ABC transporter substrate-binding protein [Treponema sp.]|jgi:raffinose/stachyose/melibiose transport system substrate-binding protein|nr:ABC transporter substrate-binding protein [Treponema sp.]
MKKIVLIMLLAVLLLSISACQKKDDTDPVTIIWLPHTSRDSGEGAVFYPLFDQWKAANPDINLVENYVGGDDVKIKIKADASADMLPDVFFFWGTLSNNEYLLESGMVVPTKDIVAEVPNLRMENISPSTLGTISYRGVPYGIPYTATFAGFFVNTAIYEKCGVPLPDTYPAFTYEQFRKDAEVFRKNGYIPLAHGWEAGNPGHFYLSQLINQLPGGTQSMLDLLNYKNMAGSGNLATGMRYVIEDIRLGVYQDNVIADSWNQMTALFQQERAAANYTHVNQLGQFNNDPVLASRIKLMPFPKIPEAVKDSNQQVAIAPAYNYFVSAKSWKDPKKRQAIVRFLDFIFGKEAIIAFTKFQQPALSFDFDIPEENFSTIYKNAAKFAHGKEEVPFFLAVVPDSAAWQNFKNVLMEIVIGQLSPENGEKAIGAVFAEMGK